MEKITLDKKSLRKFGLTMAIAFMLISIVMLLRHKQGVLPVAVLSAVFLALGVIKPSLLQLVYIFWMKLAYALGSVNTRLILSILFYLICAPAGLAMRLFKVDLLERKIDKAAATYWKKRESDANSYEKQF